MPMTYDEFSMKTREILTQLENPEEVGKITDTLIAEFKERFDSAESATAEVEKLKQINERLQRVNGELLMRTGVKGETNDLAGSEEVKNVDFSELFDESGELKEV